MNKVTFDGSLWVALGSATLCMTRYGLRVANIGDTGEDGVRQSVPNGAKPAPPPNTFHRLIRSGLENPDAPVGAFFRVTQRGSIKGSPDEVISRLTATKCDDEKCKTGNYVNLSMDLSPLSPDSLTLEYIENGAVVFAESGLSAMSEGCCTKLPDDWGASGATWIFRTTIAPPIVGECNDPQKGSVAVDEVRFVPIGRSLDFEGPFSVDWTASQIESFIILPACREAPITKA